jgi:D-sedoheptulose 7-phosphate isomerase
MVDAAAVCTVQEVHLVAIHIMCAAVDAAVRDGTGVGGRSAAEPVETAVAGEGAR